MGTTKKKTKNFKFKKFTITGGFSGMPVSTDSILLGAWIDADQGDSILDIGAGTGLLSLMCAQRFLTSHIVAVEIDSETFKLAKLNFTHSPWSEKIHIFQQDILMWQSAELFDVIICNPPYFNSGQHSDSKQRAQARHTTSLDHTKLLQKCWTLSTETGKANFILPLVEGKKFIEISNSLGWYVCRKCAIKPNENKPINRILIELSKQNTPLIETKLTISTSGSYSQDFITLTKEFYLKM